MISRKGRQGKACDNFYGIGSQNGEWQDCAFGSEEQDIELLIKQLGDEDEEVVLAAVKALSDKDSAVRRYALEALKKIGTPEALKAVEEQEKNR